MAERKIHNFKSEILIQETYDKFGYLPEIFGEKSAKFVVASCRYCGKQADIRKGFFNKAGSACHKECRIEEMKQQKSPFSNPLVRERAKQTNLKRYGSEIAQKNKNVAKQISKGRKKAQSSIETTNIEKYGYPNVFQNENIKQKSKQTVQSKYGVDHPQQSIIVQEKTKATNIEKYGVDNPWKSPEIIEQRRLTNLERYGVVNPMQNSFVAQRSKDMFSQQVAEDKDGKYKIVNLLRGEDIWQKMREGHSLKEISSDLNINYSSLTAALLRDEIYSEYYSNYTFPSQQLQFDLTETIKQWNDCVIMNDRSVIPPLELDIYVPDRKLAIEFNGSYWHSEAVLDTQSARKKHVNKTKLCEKLGIRLIHVFEHTFLNRQDQVLNFLRSALGANEHRIAARKCQITHDDANWFLDKYHIQGGSRGVSRFFNIVYKGDIVGCMTAGSHHEKGGEKGVCVLTRLAFKSNITVQGGCCKMFKYFCEWARGQGYKKIVSWSDNSLTDGHAYPNMGFELDAEHSPGYFYFDIRDQSYKTRQSQRKTNKLRPDGMTIVEWNKGRGVFAIWDCGKKRHVYYL